jgi:DMSO/TMAO reductase YedYZ molybdopterin-dependent catalytic subunit
MKLVLRNVVLLAGFAWVTAGCGSAPSSDIVALETVEIREYQGEYLSSIGSLPDNSIKGPQAVSLDTYRLRVTGLVDKPLELTYDQVLAHDAYSKVVTLHCVEGWDATILWEGVLISDLIDEAGVQPAAVIAIFHAADGYTSSIDLNFIRANHILLAYKMNGVTLPPERGFPFQVVAEAKWGYKWVKWVTEIELSDDPNYEGYWESRGYNNDGNEHGPMFAP